MLAVEESGERERKKEEVEGPSAGNGEWGMELARMRERLYRAEGIREGIRD